PAASAAPQPNGNGNGFHMALKTQLTGSDARAERLVRQVRSELEDLRQSITRIREIPEALTELDLAAVAADPDAAAALPPGLLVRALIEARERNNRLEKRIAKQRDRIERLEEKVRDLKQERAWLRGRMETFEDVIAALHANIEDLRLHRDSARALGIGAESPALPAPAPAAGEQERS
ncbi:MAG: hypothetical protein ACM3S1_11350, partial [Hyphomicrobiales bacterium]